MGLKMANYATRSCKDTNHPKTTNKVKADRLKINGIQSQPGLPQTGQFLSNVNLCKTVLHAFLNAGSESGWISV